jgi:hypothetical protein
MVPVMSAVHKLQDAYTEWRRLAETEGEAIRTRNWPLVADCQKALQQLQPQISHYLQDAQQEGTRLGLDCAAKEKSLRAVVAELIEIEQRSNTRLEVMRRDAQARLGQLEQAGRTLRQVQRSYAPAHPTAWTSLS